MYICDKCCFYNKYYPKTMNAYDELLGKTEVELGGCPMYKELTIDEMFADERKHNCTLNEVKDVCDKIRNGKE